MRFSVMTFNVRGSFHDDVLNDWDKRRIAAMQEISRELQALVPAEKSAQASIFHSLMLEPDPNGIREAFDIIMGSKE